MQGLLMGGLQQATCKPYTSNLPGVPDDPVTLRVSDGGYRADRGKDGGHHFLSVRGGGGGGGIVMGGVLDRRTLYPQTHESL